MWLGWMALVAWLCVNPSGGSKRRRPRLASPIHASHEPHVVAYRLLVGPVQANAGVLHRGRLNPLLQTDLMVIHPPLIFDVRPLPSSDGHRSISSLHERDRRVGPRMLHPARPGSDGHLGHRVGGLWAYPILDWGGYWLGTLWRPVPSAVAGAGDDRASSHTAGQGAPRSLDWRWTRDRCFGVVRHHGHPRRRRLGLVGSHLRPPITARPHRCFRPTHGAEGRCRCDRGHDLRSVDVHAHRLLVGRSKGSQQRSTFGAEIGMAGCYSNDCNPAWVPCVHR